MFFLLFVKASNQALSYNNKLSEWLTSSFTLTFFLFDLHASNIPNCVNIAVMERLSLFRWLSCFFSLSPASILLWLSMCWVVKFDCNIPKCRCSSSNRLIRDDECNNDMAFASTLFHFRNRRTHILTLARRSFFSSLFISYNCSNCENSLLLLLDTFTDVCMSVFRFWCRNFSFFPYECLFVCLRVTEAKSIDSHDKRTTSSSYKQQ